MRTVLFAVSLLLAGASLAGNKPLMECDEIAETRLDVGPCLDDMLEQAEQEHSEAVAATKKAMVVLSDVTGRLDPVLSFDGAQREFENYRALNCAWYFEQLSPGTDAGDAQKACRIKLTRYRTQELKDLLPDPSSED